MRRITCAVLSAVALGAASFACSSNSSAPLAPTLPTSNSTASADGSTLKASAPGAQSPVGDQRLETTDAPMLTISAAKPTYGDAALQYRFQLMNAGGGVIQTSGLTGTSWQPAAQLDPDTKYLWHARAEFQGNAGPWSQNASFLTAEGGYIRGSAVYDPLTNGKSAGQVHGGTFIPGQGWQSLSLTDGIDYDIQTCPACRVEFDATNFGKGEGAPYSKDLKWLSMADAPAFGNFQAFRDTLWKMHLEQRADFDGTGMKLIWRNGDWGNGIYHGDHTAKLNSAVNWQSSQVYHFVFDYDPSGFTISINGDVWFTDTFGGIAYAPPNQRVELGCIPRQESFVGLIYRNMRVTPK